MISTFNNKGSTALTWASKNGHRSTVEILLDHGEDVNASDKFGQRPLLQAASVGHFDIGEKLIDHDADLDATTLMGRLL